MEEGVRDDVFDGDLVAVLLKYLPGPAVEVLGSILILGEAIPPVAESTLGELHDITLVDEGHTGELVSDGIFDGGPYQPVGPLLGDRLIPMPDESGKRILANLSGKFSFSSALSRAVSSSPS